VQRTSMVRPPAGLLAVVVAAGSAGLFATYWDDAWHTDLGRDQAFIPPYLLLYGSMAVIGAVVAAWGLVALRRGRSLAATRCCGAPRTCWPSSAAWPCWWASWPAPGARDGPSPTS
jgi:hypothetical protein